MATIPGVADGELIRTSWGDAVADELNGNTVKIAGSAMTGNLSTTGQITAAGDIITGQALRGATVVSVGTVTVSSGGVSAPGQVLTIGTVNASGVTASGSVQAGGFPYTPAAGTAIAASGVNASLVDDTPAEPNWYLFRSGSSYTPAGSPYVKFCAATGATTLGSITVASGSSVAYNTTSDPRLKERTGDLDDAAAGVQALGKLAYRGRWIADHGEGEEWAFLNSTDVEDVAPFAVTGERDAVDDDGNIVPQSVDYAALVPVLTAALAQALDRIEALEANR